MNEKIHLLVVDDHTVVRKGLCSLLSEEKYGIEVVGEAVDGVEAIEKARSLNPEVILLDLAMPRMSGLEAIPVIQSQNPDARILILTSYAEDEQVIEAINSGALGYLMKDASPDELVSTIHNVYLNRLSLPQDIARKILSRSNETDTKPSIDGPTERELDVLHYVAMGYSNKQIAAQLHVSHTTVRTHVSSLLRKLNLDNRTQLALYASQNKTIGN
jgi:NarL family two-component system response regulator LiaR